MSGRVPQLSDEVPAMLAQVAGPGQVGEELGAGVGAGQDPD